MRKIARVLFWIGVSVCGALGIVHTVFTFVIFNHLTPPALYFAGTGLAAIVLALFNIAIWCGPSPSRWGRSLNHAANALLAVFALVAIFAVPEPQAYLRHRFLGAAVCRISSRSIVSHPRGGRAVRLTFRAVGRVFR